MHKVVKCYMHLCR